MMDHVKKQLVLNKGSEKFLFRYQEGNEGQLLDAFVNSATDPQTSFDWFDAAVLSFKLTQQQKYPFPGIQKDYNQEKDY